MISPSALDQIRADALARIRQLEDDADDSCGLSSIRREAKAQIDAIIEQTRGAPLSPQARELSILGANG